MENYSAIILAAGSGERFKSAGEQTPKPLLRLGGISLLERTARTAFKAGAREIVIVLGARAPDIQQALEKPLSNLPIRWVINNDWEKGNGTSVLAAAPLLNTATYLVLMADHLIFPQTLTRAVRASIHSGVCTMAVDSKKGGLQDPDDATKVTLSNGRITTIDKKLTTFDAFDTGVSVCNRELIEALKEKARAQDGRVSHTEGMRRLADSGRLLAYDIGADRWEDVDNAASFKVAEKLLFQSLRKSTDGFMSKHLERHLSGWVTRRLMNTSINPNHITVALVLLGAVAAYLFAQGDHRSRIAGALLFWCTSFLDGCDGELARLKFKESHLGGWLDLWSDNIVHMMVFFGIGFGLWRETGLVYWIYLGIAAATGVLASVSWVSLTRVRRQKDGPHFVSVVDQSAPASGSLSSFLGKAADVLSRRDFIFGVIFITIFGYLPYFLWAAAIGSHVYWMVLVLLSLCRPKS